MVGEGNSEEAGLLAGGDRRRNEGNCRSLQSHLLSLLITAVRKNREEVLEWVICRVSSMAEKFIVAG